MEEKRYLSNSESQDTKDPDTCLALREKLIRVSGYGEILIPPDRSRISITVSSIKSTKDEAVKSVKKRVDYISHTLMSFGAKEKEISITQSLSCQEASSYLMQSDIEAIFTKIEDCQAVAVFLVQKLDTSVKIAQPRFFHSSAIQEICRRKATVDAVKNAHHKAAEMASVFGMAIGEPLLIIEESSTVTTRAQSTNPKYMMMPDVTPVRQNLAEATFIAESVVTVKFEIKSKAYNEKYSKKARKHDTC